MNNLYFHDPIVSKDERNIKLKQKGLVYWLTGLSGSGKSTIATKLERKLIDNNIFCFRLDGDNVRLGLNSDLGFEMEDRKENLRRISHVAKLFKDANVITLVSFISPLIEQRFAAKQIIGDDFIEVYVKADIETCINRDPKGIYKKAISGEIKNFTGISSPYEIPKNPEIILDTESYNVEQLVDTLYNDIKIRLKVDKKED